MNSGSIGKDDVEIVDHQPSHIENLSKPSHVTEIGTFRVVGLTPEDADFYTNYPEEKRKKVFHKVRRHILWYRLSYQIDFFSRSTYVWSLC
jgi:hypothetical protein